MEFVIGILGAGIGSGLMAIVLAILQRKWAKEDKCDARIDALITAEKVMMIDRVRYLGSLYIKEQSISLDNKETLTEMYQAYKGLGGNGHLDMIMHEVDKIPVVEE